MLGYAHVCRALPDVKPSAQARFGGGGGAADGGWDVCQPGLVAHRS
jgi:hypothetical protein